MHTLHQVKDSHFSGSVSPAFAEVTVSFETVDMGPVTVVFDFETFESVSMAVPEHYAVTLQVPDKKFGKWTESPPADYFFPITLFSIPALILGFVFGMQF